MSLAGRPVRVVRVFALLLLLLPAFAGAQGVGIEHSGVDCLVAEQFPLIDACFSPGSGLARSRVYFRPEGTASWYYVDQWTHREPKAEASCLQAALPKPRKSLIQKRVEYYVEATGRTLGETQSATFKPLVVKAESECKDKKAAPYVPNAVVTVFPALPAAFAVGAGAGGLGALGVAAIVGAGVAGGVGVGVAASNDDNPSAPATTPATNPPATITPATAPTTTAPPSPANPFNAVFKVFRNGALVNGSAVAGAEPVQLRFFMCESTGPLRLRFNVLVNGVVTTAGCDTTITFAAGGFAASFGGVSAQTGVRASGTVYSVVMQIQSDGPGNNPKDNRGLSVDVSATGPVPTTTSTSTSTTSSTSSTTSSSTTSSTSTSSTSTTLPAGCVAGDFAGPTVNLTSPTGGTFTPGGYPVTFSGTATDAEGSTVIEVDYCLRINQATPSPLNIDTCLVGGTPPFTFDWQESDVDSFLGPGICEANSEMYAIAFDACFNSSISAPVAVKLIHNCSTSLLTTPRLEESAQGVWASQLEVAGARGQVILNGSQALFPERGRVALRLAARPGENRLEATLVRAEGKPGLWRFELGRSVEAGSLRVVAGEAALVTADALVFRMKGRPGERVVFTFRTRP